MKHLKKLICFYCLFFTVYAHGSYEKGFKILSEKQTITAGAQGGVKTLVVEHDKDLDNPAKALTYSADVIGHLNGESEIHGQHSIFVTNQSRIPQRFQYKQTLTCAGRTIENMRWVEIEPDGTFEDDTRTFLIIRQQATGVYPAKATTEISGLYNTYSEAYGSITIR